MTTTNTNKLSYERSKLLSKTLILDDIDLANHQLDALIRDHKDTESKELEIHQLWVQYNDL